MAKHQQSTIDRLPDDIRTKLQELLRDPRVTQLNATARINAILEEQGLDTLSKSAVNRYAVKMEEVGKKLRQSREIARMWVGRLGAEPLGEVGKLLNEMVRTLAFEATMAMAEGSDPVEPKMLKDLSIAIERLEQAASQSVKREEEIRKAERQRIKAELEKAEAAAGDKKDGRRVLDAQTIKSIREQLKL